MRLLRLLSAAIIAAPTILTAQATQARWVTAVRAADDAALDSAITKLEGFLEEYPNSNVRPNALLQLGELLVRRADEEFSESQRATAATTDSGAASREGQIRPNYAPAIARYEELVRRFPTFSGIDAAAYTLGTLYRASSATPTRCAMFELVTAKDSRTSAARRSSGSAMRTSSSRRSCAAQPRKAMFVQRGDGVRAARRRSLRRTATSTSCRSTSSAGRTTTRRRRRTRPSTRRRSRCSAGSSTAYDKLTPEQQARLGLRGEAIEYMAVAFTQVGGAEAAQARTSRRTRRRAVSGCPCCAASRRAFATRVISRAPSTRTRRCSHEAPTDPSALGVPARDRRHLSEPHARAGVGAGGAARARRRASRPDSAWAKANPPLARQRAGGARRRAAPERRSTLLAGAQQDKKDRAQFAEAAAAVRPVHDASSRRATARRPSTAATREALFGERRLLQGRRGVFARGVRRTRTDPEARAAGGAERDRRVRFGARARQDGDRAAQDSLFAVGRPVRRRVPGERMSRKKALIEKGTRASEAQRWDVMAATFQTYADELSERSVHADRAEADR